MKMLTVLAFIFLGVSVLEAARLRGVRLASPPTPAAAVATVYPSPISVAPGGRYLVDQTGAPFLITGDSPHNLATGYSTEDAAIYLRNRASNGVNTLWVECLTGPYTYGPANGSNIYCQKPFTNTVSGGLYDFTSPNIAYWQQISNVLVMAATNGIIILLDTLETGEYAATAVANGTNRCRQYGQFLGSYFKPFTNIVWITGNDYTTWETPADDAAISSIARGVKDNDTNHLHTIQLNYDVSMSTDNTNWLDIISINGVYSYFVTYEEILLAYNTNTMPVLFLEGNYEEELLRGGGSLVQLRCQEYYSLLSGSLAGNLWGNKYVWRPLEGWQTNLNTPGMLELRYFRGFFTNLAWHTLVPDQTHKLVSAGYGTKSSGAVYNKSNNYAVAAMNTNRTLGVVYTPTNHTLTVRMTNFSQSVTSRWFDPTANTLTAITGSPFANTIATNLTPPGNNAGGAGDWVLLLESAP